MRSCGVLLPVFSLPSEFGIGCFSKEAYRFVEFCEKAGLKQWQVLPLGPTGFGNSPYQTFSAFAINPYFIDLEDLVVKGLLTEEECQEDHSETLLRGEDMPRVGIQKEKTLSEMQSRDTVSPAEVDYDGLYGHRLSVLHKAWLRFRTHGWDGYEDFLKENDFWLRDYALYMALKDAHEGRCWMQWEEPLRRRDPKAIQKAERDMEEPMQFYCFLQFFAVLQWNTVHDYAKQHGVHIIGDIPIYVAYDSVDVWSHPEYFLLNEDGSMQGVAGCPPDAFSQDGQLWGNPLYDWKYQKEDGYSWWIRRIRHNLELFDSLRIDHFRGFDEFFCIPAEDETARNGQWMKGPGIEFFQQVKHQLGELPLIAEDLGVLTPSVYRLVEDSGFPGMKVLEFAFSAGSKSTYLPHRYERNCVVYTGTHDNDTVRGWFDNLSQEDKDYVSAYVGQSLTAETAAKGLIRLAMASVADTCIIPMQDFLNLGSEARMNFPSTMEHNWVWRVTGQQLTDVLAEEIHTLVELYER